MATYDEQTAASLAADPQTPAQTLADIAAQHPALWGLLRQHPHMYPALAEWIDRAWAAQTAAAVQQQAPAAVQPQQAAYVDPGYPAPQPAPRRRTGLIVGIVTAVAVVLAGIGIAIPFALGAFGGNGGSLQDGLELVAKPRGEFTVNILDTKRFIEAIGEPFPTDGDHRDYEDWLDRGLRGDDQIIAVDAARAPFELTPLVFSTRGMIQLADREGDGSANAFIGNVSESFLDEHFGAARGGVWQVGSGGNTYSVTQHEGATYFSWAGDSPASERPETGRTLASDESVAAILALLEKSNGYAYTIERDSVPSDNAYENTGNALDTIITYGSSLSLRDGEPYLTLAYDFGTSGTAEANLDGMTEALRASAEGLEVDDPVDVRTEGRFVVAEYELRSGSLLSVAFDLRNLYNW